MIFSFAALSGIGVGISAKHMYHKWLESSTYPPAPAGMVVVPAGSFLMGSDHPGAEDDERPMRYVFVKAFYIDKHEITNATYQRYVPGHHYPEGNGNLPITGVLRDEAERFCRLMGKRLPTNAEWEKAARGTDGRTYPWGDDLLYGRANIRYDGSKPTWLMPVGSFPLGISPSGCYDMSGNVWEWVINDVSGLSAFETGSGKFVRGIVRGGAFRYSPYQARTSYQGFEDPALTCNDIGFRCAKDAHIVSKVR